MGVQRKAQLVGIASYSDELQRSRINGLHPDIAAKIAVTGLRKHTYEGLLGR